MLTPKRRVWRKIHLGIDEETLEIRAVEVTGSHIGDAPVLPDLLGQIPIGEEIGSVTADGASSRGFARSGLKQATGLFPRRPSPRKCYDAIADRGAHAFVG